MNALDDSEAQINATRLMKQLIKLEASLRARILSRSIANILPIQKIDVLTAAITLLKQKIDPNSNQYQYHQDKLRIIANEVLSLSDDWESAKASNRMSINTLDKYKRKIGSLGLAYKQFKGKDAEPEVEEPVSPRS